MDEVREFFLNPRPTSERIKLRGPLTGGFRIVKNDENESLNRKEEHRHAVMLPGGTEYAREVKRRETELYLRVKIYLPKLRF